VWHVSCDLLEGARCGAPDLNEASMADCALRESVDPTLFGQGRASYSEATTVSECMTRKSCPVQLDLISDFAAFEALENDWNELFEAFALPTHVFQSFGWCWHWCRHDLAREAGAGPRLAIVTGRLDGRLVLVMPFVSERRAGLVHLQWLGEPVSQYGDILAAPEASGLDVLERAWDLVVDRTGADLASLRKVRADAQVAPLMQHLGAMITATEEALAIELDRFEGAQALFAQNPHKRKNRRRLRKRMEEQGATAFETHRGSERAGDLASEAIGLKRQWLKDKGQISPAMTDARFECFFRDAARGLGPDSGCTILALKAGDTVAALQIVLECKKSRFLHLCVYDTAYEKCSAGSLLLEDAIVDSYRTGTGTFDLLAPRHAYKAEFADRVVAVSDHGLALSWRGKAYVSGVLACRQRVKRGITTLPVSVRRTLASGLALLNRCTGKPAGE
jgi:CelD/BcsL family acetyltransferase involved in cellulose biosynthesis